MNTDAVSAKALEEWRRHLKHASDEIQELWLDRYVWRTTSQIVAGCPAVNRSPFFVTWVGTQYYRRAALCVRTMTDTRRDSHSLLRLLQCIVANPEYLDCPGWMPADYRAAGSTTLNRQRVQRDITELKAVLGPVETYATNDLAHIKQEMTAVIPDPSAVNAAVELLGTMLKRYTLLLTGGDLDVEPRVLFRWTDTFNKAWLPVEPPASSNPPTTER